jgi:hypothetical protein
MLNSSLSYVVINVKPKNKIQNTNVCLCHILIHKSTFKTFKPKHFNLQSAFLKEKRKITSSLIIELCTRQLSQKLNPKSI